MKAIREVEHTADRAYSVRGRNIRELFENAAQAMFNSQEKPRRGAILTTHEVKVDGADYETLLVNWLNELFYLQERCHEKFDNTAVLELSKHALRAKVSGRAGVGVNLIKAVTFHGLKIQHVGRMFQTTFVVDV